MYKMRYNAYNSVTRKALHLVHPRGDIAKVMVQLHVPLSRTFVEEEEEEKERDRERERTFSLFSINTYTGTHTDAPTQWHRHTYSSNNYVQCTRRARRGRRYRG